MTAALLLAGRNIFNVLNGKGVIRIYGYISPLITSEMVMHFV
jgi:hypothetical protein